MKEAKLNLIREKKVIVQVVHTVAKRQLRGLPAVASMTVLAIVASVIAGQIVTSPQNTSGAASKPSIAQPSTMPPTAQAASAVYAPQDKWDPGFPDFGFADHTDYVLCSNFDSGSIARKTVFWRAYGGNEVSIYVTLTTKDAIAKTGFTKIASGLKHMGRISVPFDCGTRGASTPLYYTVKLVAKNSRGSAAAYFEGGVGKRTNFEKQPLN
jgi:hypothetical protein